MGRRIAKTIRVRMADSTSDRMMPTIQASQAGHFRLMKAWAWAGRASTRERTREKMPVTKVTRKGQRAVHHSWGKGRRKEREQGRG